MLTGLTELTEAVEAAERGDIADIARLRAQRGAHNQGFTVTMFAMSEIGRCMEAVRAAIGALAKADGKPDEPATVAFVRAHVGVTRRRYGLENTARYLELLADALESDSVGDARTAAGLLGDYLNFLQFLIAVDIPWHELGVAFEGARTVGTAYADRMVADHT